MLVSTFLNKTLQNIESRPLAAVDGATLEKSGWDERDCTLGRIPEGWGLRLLASHTLFLGVEGAIWPHVHPALVSLLAKEAL